MTDHSNTRSKSFMGTWLRPLIGPILLAVVGISLIALLGVAQRAGWIRAGGDSESAPPPAVAESVLYVCPMMCTPPMEAPGRCPVCEMELVASTGQSNGDDRSVEIDPVSRRIANIRTVPVEARAVVQKVRAIGRITYDEGMMKTLAAYVDGRIERMYADYTGVVVEKGDALAMLYSPDLYTAQSELLAARRATSREPSTLYSKALDPQRIYEGARRKLVDLGMSDRQIEQLETAGIAETRLELVAPICGTVLEKMVSEGDYVKVGQPIYRLADLTSVWLMLELFPEDSALVRYGQRIHAEVQSHPGEEFGGRVAFIDPAVDPKTRTVGIRVVMDNEDGRLTIGDYATAEIAVVLGATTQKSRLLYDTELAGKWISPRHPHVIEDSAGTCRLCGVELVPASSFGFSEVPIDRPLALVVPRSAVLMAGDHSVVYVEVEEGRFELRVVEIGPSLGDEIVIRSGVEEGESVAVGGNFLIDSQMQLGGNPSLIDPTKAEPPDGSEDSDALDLFPDIELPEIGPIEILDSDEELPGMAGPPTDLTEAGEIEIIETPADSDSDLPAIDEIELLDPEGDE